VVGGIVEMSAASEEGAPRSLEWEPGGVDGADRAEDDVGMEVAGAAGHEGHGATTGPGNLMAVTTVPGEALAQRKWVRPAVRW
jgi:hypothetical protein